MSALKATGNARRLASLEETLQHERLRHRELRDRLWQLSRDEFHARQVVDWLIEKRAQIEAEIAAGEP